MDDDELFASIDAAFAEVKMREEMGGVPSSMARAFWLERLAVEVDEAMADVAHDAWWEATLRKAVERCELRTAVDAALYDPIAALDDGPLFPSLDTPVPFRVYCHDCGRTFDVLATSAVDARLRASGWTSVIRSAGVLQCEADVCPDCTQVSR